MELTEPIVSWVLGVGLVAGTTGLVLAYAVIRDQQKINENHFKKTTESYRQDDEEDTHL